MPPRNIQHFIYLCDSKFHTESLEPLFEESKAEYGVVIVKGEEALLYTVGTHLQPTFLKRLRKSIPNNHRRGGQSQARIGRLRDEAIHNYLMMIVEAINTYYVEEGIPVIKHLILSGPAFKKEMLRDKLRLDIPITLLTAQNIDEVIEDHAEDILNEESKKEAKDHISDIFELIRIDPDKLVFGVDVEKAYTNNQLEKLYVYDISSWKKKIKKDSKTKVIEVCHHVLQSYGGSIGIRWY